MKIIGAMFVFMPQRADADAALAESFDKLVNVVDRQDKDNHVRRRRAERRNKKNSAPVRP